MKQYEYSRLVRKRLDRKDDGITVIDHFVKRFIS